MTAVRISHQVVVFDAADLAATSGAQFTGIASPFDAPAALARLFDR